jgi:hypothetical protein
MILDLLTRLPLFAAYVLGSVLTLVMLVRRKTVSSALGFLGFFLLAAVQAVSPFTTQFNMSLYVRGVPFTRASTLIALASATLNSISAVAVLCIVGAIALASRPERSV